VGKSMPAGSVDWVRDGGAGDERLGMTGSGGVGGEIFTIGAEFGPGGRGILVKMTSLKI